MRRAVEQSSPPAGAARVTISIPANIRGIFVQLSVRITSARRARVAQILKFAGVGCVGVGVNTGVLYVLDRLLGLPLVAASAIAVELAVISNYLMNERWTFATRQVSFRRFVKFNIASLCGLTLNVAIVWSLARFGIYFLAANLVGIAVGFAGNFILSSIWVWGQILWRES
jgi:putative flippase GtrA